MTTTCRKVCCRPVGIVAPPVVGTTDLGPFSSDEFLQTVTSQYIGTCSDIVSTVVFPDCKFGCSSWWMTNVTSFQITAVPGYYAIHRRARASGVSDDVGVVVVVLQLVPGGSEYIQITPLEPFALGYVNLPQGYSVFVFVGNAVTSSSTACLCKKSVIVDVVGPGYVTLVPAPGMPCPPASGTSCLDPCSFVITGFVSASFIQVLVTQPLLGASTSAPLYCFITAASGSGALLCPSATTAFTSLVITVQSPILVPAYIQIAMPGNTVTVVDANTLEPISGAIVSSSGSIPVLASLLVSDCPNLVAFSVCPDGTVTVVSRVTWGSDGACQPCSGTEACVLTLSVAPGFRPTFFTPNIPPPPPLVNAFGFRDGSFVYSSRETLFDLLLDSSLYQTFGVTSPASPRLTFTPCFPTQCPSTIYDRNVPAPAEIVGATSTSIRLLMPIGFFNQHVFIGNLSSDDGDGILVPLVTLASTDVISAGLLLLSLQLDSGVIGGVVVSGYIPQDGSPVDVSGIQAVVNASTPLDFVNMGALIVWVRGNVDADIYLQEYVSSVVSPSPIAVPIQPMSAFVVVDQPGKSWWLRPVSGARNTGGLIAAVANSDLVCYDPNPPLSRFVFSAVSINLLKRRV